MEAAFALKVAGIPQFPGKEQGGTKDACVVPDIQRGGVSGGEQQGEHQRHHCGEEAVFAAAHGDGAGTQADFQVVVAVHQRVEGVVDERPADARAVDDGGCYKSRGESVINGKNREAAGKYGKKN